MPSVLIPIILGGLSSIIPCNSLASSVVLMVAGLFFGITMFFDFAQKQEEYSNTANKFFELNTNIAAELSKPKSHRVACDVYLERIKNRYSAIVLLSPDI